MVVLIFRLEGFYFVGFVLFVVFFVAFFFKLSLKKANVREFVVKEARLVLLAIMSSLSSSNVKIWYHQVPGFSGVFHHTSSILSHSFP